MAPSKEVTTVTENRLIPIDPDQTLKASKALLAHIKKAAKEKEQVAEKKSLLGSEEDAVPIWLTLTTKRHIVDSPRLKPGKISLPHPLNTHEEQTICLITADPQRAYKDLVAEIPDPLRSRITRVIDITHLKKKFGQYEAQRKLHSEHEIFLGDDRIINRLPGALGKSFYKTTVKRPIPVSIAGKQSKNGANKDKKTKSQGSGSVNAATPEQLAREIEKAIGSALVSLTPSTNTSVRVADSSFAPEQVAENVQAVARGLVEKFVPRGLRNVKNVLIKGPETASMPVWQTDELWLDEKDVVADPTEEEKQKALTEKANVGKKRKALAAAPAAIEDEDEKPAKKSKKEKKAAAVPESNDDKLDKQITERKDRLKKQKAKAKAAMD